MTEVVGNDWEENLRVTCIGCLAQSGRYRTRAEAVKAWNTRADLAAPDGNELEAAKAIVNKRARDGRDAYSADLTLVDDIARAIRDAVRRARRDQDSLDSV